MREPAKQIREFPQWHRACRLGVQGAVIAEIDADAPAGKAGLREGDVIQEVNKRPVPSARFSSNVEEDSGLPAAILFLDTETMEGDRFNVGALLMTCVVQSFAGDFCFQKICFTFLVNLRFAGSQ